MIMIKKNSHLWEKAFGIKNPFFIITKSLRLIQRNILVEANDIDYAGIARGRARPDTNEACYLRICRHISQHKLLTQ